MSNKYMPSDHAELMASLEQMLVAITVINNYIDSVEKNAGISESVKNESVENDNDEEDDEIEAIFDEDNDEKQLEKSILGLETLETANLALQSFHMFVESYFDRLDDLIRGTKKDEDEDEDESEEEQ